MELEIYNINITNGLFIQMEKYTVKTSSIDFSAKKCKNTQNKHYIQSRTKKKSP